MTGKVTIIFIDPEKKTFGDSKVVYQHANTVDNEGQTEWVYFPASAGLKVGDSINVSAQYNDKHTYKLKYLVDKS